MFGASSCHSCALLSCFLSLSYSRYLFCLPWTLFVFNLTPQADPSTLKNFDFARGILLILINRRFLYKDDLQRISGLSSAHLWPSWGALGGSFRNLGVFRWLPEILKLLFLHPGAPKLPPEEPSTAPNSAPGALIVKQKAPRSHHGLHFGTDAFRYLAILAQNPQRKDSRGHRQGISEATLGLSSSMFFFRFFS